MKSLILMLMLFLSLVLVSCNDGGSGGGGTAAVAITCNSFVLDTEMIIATYEGTTVTTVGACDNVGQEYIITTDGDYTFGASITGWRLINSNLDTQGGDIAFATGGRFQTANGINEGHGLTFAGVDHTTCQNDSAQNGVADLFEISVTAEFDSDCVPQLRGTFREYSQCIDASEVTICSGTITLIQ